MKTTVNESAARGQKIRTETAPDRSDVAPTSQDLMGKMKGDNANLDHSIKNGKVPTS